MLASFRAAMLRRSLRKLLASQQRRRKIHTLKSARSIGILFDATSETNRKELLQFAAALEKSGKKIRLLGFINGQNPPEQSLFPQFTQKDRRWTGIPNSEALSAFVADSFDVLLCLNPEQVLLLDWAAAAAQAAMKIGTFTEHPNDFDMLLETPAEKGIRFFIDQLDLYLNKIVPSNYESAAAL